MLVHYRTAVRRAVAAIVRAAAPSLRSVQAHRVHAWPEASLPAAAVYTTDESAEPVDSASAPLLSRTVTVVVEIQAVGDSADDALDQATGEIEAALPDDSGLGPIADLVLTSIETAIADDAGQPISRQALIYQAQITARQGDPWIQQET